MEYSAYELGQYEQIFDRLQYGNVEDSRDDYVSIYEFPINISKMDMASKEEIRAVDRVSEMFSEMIDNRDLPADMREVAESSLKGLADKGYVSAQELYIESLHERGYYEEAYTYANDIANNPTYVLSDEGELQISDTTRRMSKYRQNALTDWGRDVVGRISISSDEDMKWPLKDAQKLAEAYPDAGKYDLGFEPEELSGTLYDVAKREEMSPELRESAQASLKQLADKGYPEAQKQYAFRMEKQGNYDEAYTYMDKVANNELGYKDYQKIAAASAQDYLYKGKYKDSFDRLGKGQMADEDVSMCKEFCEKAKPGLIGTEGTDEAIEKLSDALHPYLSSKKKQEIIEPLKGLADKGYLNAQVEMAYKGSSNYEQVYAYADKAAKYMQEDDYFKGEKSDQVMKVSCAFINTANNAKNPELRAKAEASLKQMADKGCFTAQEAYANLMEERGDYGKASVYARKASDNEHASEAAQDRLSKYAHKMYQKHQKNREAPKKESPQISAPVRDNVKPKPSFKERLVEAGSKGAIGIIKASRAFAQTGLQLADTVLDSGVKMAGAFIDVPDLGIGRGMQGYLTKGIDKAANAGVSLVEAARKKAIGR